MVVSPYLARAPGRAPRAARPAAFAGAAGLAAILVGLALLACSAAAAPSLLVPGGRRAFPDWLAGPLAGLGSPVDAHDLGVLLVVLLAGWGVALATAAAIPRSAVVAAVVAAHVVCLLAPPILSADVFGYIAFARLHAVHALDPYVVGTAAAPGDPVQAYLRWRNASSPYGPLFTLGSEVLVPLGVAGAVWAFKVLTCAASLATVALVWRLAERHGRDARAAAVLVGLNPVVLAFAVGGAHNDLFLALLLVAGIGLALGGREAPGLATLVVGAGVKLSGGLVVPFALLGAVDRRRALTGAVAGGVAVVVIAVAGFGTGAVRSLTTSLTAADGVSTFSVPTTVARHLGLATPGATARLVLTCAALLVLATMLLRTLRGADWIASAGWATLAVLCASTWLVPWYLVWLTPLAALGDSRRLRAATVLLIAFATLTRVRFVGL